MEVEACREEVLAPRSRKREREQGQDELRTVRTDEESLPPGKAESFPLEPSLEERGDWLWLHE